MRNVKIPDWPTEFFTAWWEDAQTIMIDIYEGYRAVAVEEISISAPYKPLLPAFLQDAEENSYEYSPYRTYLVKCTGKDQDNFYHGLQLYRVADEQLIGQVENVVFNCLWGIRWAPDESALSLVVKAAEYDNLHVGTNIYVWKTDGTAPYMIGNGSFLAAPAIWSPDSKRLDVEIRNPNPTSPDDEMASQIIYLYGRPPQITGAQLWTTSHWVVWLTNHIIERGTSSSSKKF